MTISPLKKIIIYRLVVATLSRLIGTKENVRDVHNDDDDDVTICSNNHAFSVLAPAEDSM